MIQLRDYQNDITKKAISIINEYGFVYLSMEVRTGKTTTALNICNELLAKSVLFITKKKAISSINNDYNLLKPSFKIEIVNFESIHKLTDEYDFIIIDEAHSLGAFPKPSKRAVKVKKICKDKPIIFLSGTPTPESYSQIFHQFYVSSKSPFINYRNFYAWAKDYVIVRHKFMYGREINDYSFVLEDKIKEKIDHYFVSFTQKEAGFSQEINEKIVFVKMMDQTYNLAKKLKKDRVIDSSKGVILADTNVKLMNKLHQIFSGTVKFEDESTLSFDDSKCRFIYDNFSEKKIAIFYKFIEEGNLLRLFFPNNTSIPEEFNNSNELIFIGQIQSNREGVNLSSADYLIMYNIDYSAVSYFQARARMQSKNRDKEAVVYWIFAENSIDKMIYDKVKNKENFTQSYFEKKCLNQLFN